MAELSQYGEKSQLLAQEENIKKDNSNLNTNDNPAPSVDEKRLRALYILVTIITVIYTYVRLVKNSDFGMCGLCAIVGFIPVLIIMVAVYFISTRLKIIKTQGTQSLILRAVLTLAIIILTAIVINSFIHPKYPSTSIHYQSIR